jgi:inhibitor of cysteine peptidase
MKIKLDKWFLFATIPAILFGISLSGCSQSIPSSSVPASTAKLSPTIAVAVNETIFADKSFDGKKISMAPGGSLQVSLESNPTTGFKWELTRISDEGVLEKVSNTFDTPTFKLQEGSPPPVGVGGMEFWNFKALNKGTSILSMEYSQPWNGGIKGAQNFSLTVAVE